MVVFEIAFWLSAAWIAWTLVLYPLLAVAVGALAGRLNPPVRGAATPKLSFIISAYNEEKAIAEKLRQTLALDYPAEQLEVIVASDGSSDRTDEIVNAFPDPRVHLYRAEGRLGKTATLNGAVTVATGEILVFSDATGIFSPNALRALASRFADPSVGCVAGRVAYEYGRDATSEGFRGYQRVAVAVRRAENGFGDQTSVSGSIHAIRRELFRPGKPGFSMDVIDALHTVVQGRRVVYEYDAVSLEESRSSTRAEYDARVRISVRNTSMAPYIVRELVGAGRWFYLFQMVSHKMMRWWLWAPLLVAFLSSWILVGTSPLYTAAALLQTAGYAAAGVGLVRGRRGRLGRVTALLSFFVMGNAAMAVGTLKGLAGEKRPSWEPLR
jgi:cellulose synthase/poly-beta-1,6-N-acetylglucosamine synthase-like glycosyltransferase